VAWRDLGTLFDLLAGAVLGLIVPPRKWSALARWWVVRLEPSFAKRRQQLAAQLARAIPPSLLGRPAADLALDHLAARFEKRLLVMRHYIAPAWAPQVELRGAEHLTRAAQSGRGAVLWLADFVFRTPLCYAALAAAGYRVCHLSGPRHGFSQTRFGMTVLNPIMTRVERRYLAERIVISDLALAPELRVLAAMRRLKKRLLAGRIVSVSALANTWAPLEVPILNGKSRLAHGAPGLAYEVGVPVLPVFVTRDDAGQFLVTVEEPLPLASNLPRRAAAVLAAQAYANLLEGYVLRYPEQWSGWPYLRLDAPEHGTRWGGRPP
jgi:lauroyl/myristoyl acyltransferase